MGPNATNFRYLNRDGAWQGFKWDGLELRPDGALQLISLAALAGQTPDDVSALPDPDGPAGIAVDRDGSVFYSDPGGNRVYRTEGCYGTTAPVPCLGGGGRLGTELQTPRGLLIPAFRRALFVADAGNGRIQIFDPDTCQLLDIWDGAALAEPWSLAADPDGNVYVADYGSGTVVKFAISGDPDLSFWANVRVSELISAPAAVAVAADVFILDVAANTIFAFQTDGTPRCDAAGEPVAIAWSGMTRPMGLAAAGDRVYVGDNALREVLQFNRTATGFAFAGAAGGYSGPVAALALDGAGGLLVHSGAAMAPIRLTLGTGFGARGAMWSKAITKQGIKPAWYELQSAVERSSPEAHLQFFVHASDDSTPPPVAPQTADPFPAPAWRPIGLDLDDFFIGGPPARFLWVAAVLTGDHRSTPAISQIRVEFDHAGYTSNLPEIYREESPAGDFLPRFLALFESFFEEPEQETADMPALFDPQAVPAQYLPWLASWLALDLPGDANEADRRADIAAAFERYARRGTVDGLRQALLTSAGVHAIIEEPILNASWWRLPAAAPSCNAQTGAPPVWRDGGNSVLGFTTGLAFSEPQGAVVGRTATLDRSHLIATDAYGEPLFDDLASRFSVLVYPGEVACAGKLDEVRAVVEAEKPAHTAYHLCVLEPRISVGFQARVGIDTIVGGPPLPTRLGEAAGGGEFVLGGEPAGRIGISYLGQDAHL